MAEHLRDDDVILEQPHAENGESCPKGDRPGHREPDADRQSTRSQRAHDRDDLDDAREDSEQEPERHPDRPEREREHRPHEDDQEQLAANEGTQLRVDQVPGVPHGLPLIVRNDG